MVLAVVTRLPRSGQIEAALCHSVALKPLDGQKHRTADALFPGSILESPNFVGEHAGLQRSAAQEVRVVHRYCRQKAGSSRPQCCLSAPSVRALVRVHARTTLCKRGGLYTSSSRVSDRSMIIILGQCNEEMLPHSRRRGRADEGSKHQCSSRAFVTQRTTSPLDSSYQGLLEDSSAASIIAPSRVF